MKSFDVNLSLEFILYDISCFLFIRKTLENYVKYV